jgi:uncharacterized low-complexity protein
MNGKKAALSLAIGSAFAASLAVAPVANAAENPFGMQALKSGYMLAAADMDKAKDGKCGGAKDAKAKDGKCGGAKDAKAKDGKCGGAKDTKAKDGKCGEGKCGGAKKADDKK